MAQSGGPGTERSGQGPAPNNQAESRRTAISSRLVQPPKRRESARTPGDSVKRRGHKSVEAERSRQHARKLRAAICSAQASAAILILANKRAPNIAL
jgi:hypothetical protein